MVPAPELALRLYLQCAEVKIPGPVVPLFRFVVQLAWGCSVSHYLDFAGVVVHRFGEQVDLTKS